jgi:ATP-dependent protease Clp ATPase subunit
VTEIIQLNSVPRCAFCFRDATSVPKLVMGSFVGICAECVGLCLTAIGEAMAKDPAESK